MSSTFLCCPVIQFGDLGTYGRSTEKKNESKSPTVNRLGLLHIGCSPQEEEEEASLFYQSPTSTPTTGAQANVP